MAYSGLGAGTIGDPYQVTTPFQFGTDMPNNGGSSVYFKLMNDIEMPIDTPSITFNSILDGDNFRVSADLSRNTGTWGTIFNGASITNLKLSLRNAGQNTNVFTHSNRNNVTLSNLDVELFAAHGGRFAKFVNGNIPATWSVSNIKIRGNIVKIFDNVSCSLSDIHINPVGEISILSSYLCASFFGSSISNCSVDGINCIFKGSGGVLVSNMASASAMVMSNCWVRGVLRGYQFGALVGVANANSTIQDSYFIGDIISYSTSAYYDPTALVGEPVAATTITRCYAYIYNYTKKLWVSHDGPNYFPNKHSFNDWHIPSADEMSLIKAQWGKITPPTFVDTNSYALTSSESSATQCMALSFTTMTISNISKTAPSAMILVRPFSYTINDSPVLGDSYMDGIVIYKNDTTLTGLMCQKAFMAEGAPIFTFGASGVSVATETAVGTGASNTALILASTPPATAGVYWASHQYPTYAAEEVSTLLSRNPANYSNCYYAVQSSTANLTFASAAGQKEKVTTSAIRDTATFSGWNFSTVWKQSPAATLPQLVANPEALNPTINSVSKSAPATWAVEMGLASETKSANDVGLIVKIGGTEIYNQVGLSHTITLPQDKDYNLTLIPFVVDNEDHDPIYQYISACRAIEDVPVVGVFPRVNKVLNVATIGKDVLGVHGAITYNGYIYGCSRKDATVVKINMSDDADVAYCTPLTPSGLVIEQFDQIVVCNGFIWGTGKNVQTPFLVRINPATMEWKSIELPSGADDMVLGDPICSSHNRYIYVTTLRYVRKYDSLLMSGTEITSDIPGGLLQGALDATYDSHTQGGHIGWQGASPELYTGNAKGHCHQIAADGDSLYVGYTTPVTIAGLNIDNSGYSPVLGITMSELHKVRISDMTADGWVHIPRCTDDMTQSDTHVFLGTELHTSAMSVVDGFGVSVLAVRKSDLRVTKLPRLHQVNNPPSSGSYGVYWMGNDLVLLTGTYMFIIDPSNPDEWSVDQPIGKYTKKVMTLSPVITGAWNEVLRDGNETVYIFGWSGEAVASGYATTRLKTDTTIVGAPIVQTLSAALTEN